MYGQKEYMQLLKEKFSKTEIINAIKYKNSYEEKIKEISPKKNTLLGTSIKKSKDIYGFDLTKVYTFNYVKYICGEKNFVKMMTKSGKRRHFHLSV